MAHAEEVEALCAAIAAERQSRQEDLWQLRSSTTTAIRTMNRERKAASVDLARQLGQQRALLATQVISELAGMSKERRESSIAAAGVRRDSRINQHMMTAEFLAELGRERKHEAESAICVLRQAAADRRNETSSTMMALSKIRAENGTQMGRDLKAYNLGLKRFWQETGTQCLKERAGAMRAWAGLYQVALPKAAPPVADAIEQTVQQRVLDVIAANTGGITLVDIESLLGIPRVRLGVAARQLVDSGKVTKDGRLYLPAPRQVKEGETQ
ncbi:MAG: hypothetical protein Q8P50_12725 [Bacillota bacterium]|nr:hypothetical protein [Bacillota bacterium]